VDRYNAKVAYSKQGAVDSYDRYRFTSPGGKIFDAIEKNIVVSNIPMSNRKIVAIDVGTGTGRFAISLAEIGLDVVASDISMPMLSKVKEKLSSIELEVEGDIALANADIYHLAFGDNSFDYVVCIRVLNQLGRKQYIHDALNELYRVCNSRGVIIFDFINSHSLALFARREHELLSPREIRKMLAALPGCNIKEIRGSLILSQTLLEKTPRCLLYLVAKVDSLFSRFFPEYATRVYFILEKTS
jgi:ubiquinone/menaquinone biosynthesis C-methylase UbiE